MYSFSSRITSFEESGHERQPCLILMDAERRVLQASPAAHRLLETRAAITLVCGTLCACAASYSAVLCTAFRSVLTEAAPERTIVLGDGAARIEVRLVPLHGAGGTRQVIAIVGSIAGNGDEQLNHAIRRFGLTPAEGRLLKILCTGASVQQAAARLGVARTTARTHLQRIFDKSGAHRQGELQRLVFAPASAAA